MNSYISMLNLIYDIVDEFISSALYYNVFVPIIVIAIVFCTVKVVYAICMI